MPGMDQGEDLHPAAEAGRPEVDCSGLFLDAEYLFY